MTEPNPAALERAVQAYADLNGSVRPDTIRHPDGREESFPAVEEPHHAAARKLTEDERAALTKVAGHFAPKLATGGVVRSGPVIVGDSDGCVHPVLTALEQAERRARLAAALPQPEPGSVTDLLRERLGRQVARRAEARGQLDVRGA